MPAMRSLLALSLLAATAANGGNIAQISLSTLEHSSAPLSLLPAAANSIAIGPQNAHRRLETVYYSDVMATPEGEMYLTDAATWTYKYFTSVTKRIKLQFYLYETYHYPARKSMFTIKCTFNAPSQTEVERTLEKVDAQMTVPNWPDTTITTECWSIYKTNSTQASIKMPNNFETTSTTNAEAPPPIVETDPEWAYSFRWIDVQIDAVCADNCELLPTDMTDTYIPTATMLRPKMMPPVKLNFYAWESPAVATATTAAGMTTELSWNDYSMKCEYSANFLSSDSPPVLVNRSRTVTLTGGKSATIDWAGVTVAASCWLIDAHAPHARKSWSTYTEFETKQPTKEDAQAAGISDANRPAAGSGLEYVRAYVAMPLDPWLFEEKAQHNFKLAVLKTMLYEPSFALAKASFCEVGASASTQTCVSGNPDKVTIVSFTAAGVNFQVETSAHKQVEQASGTVSENKAVWNLWTSTFVSCYFSKMLVAEGAIEAASEDAVMIDTSQSFIVAEAATSVMSSLARLAAWAIALIVVPIVLLFVCLLSILVIVALVLLCLKRKNEHQKLMNEQKGIELMEEENILHFDQGQLREAQSQLEEEKKQLDEDRAALDDRKEKSKQMAADLDEMADKKAALAAEIAGIADALGSGSASKSESGSAFDEASAIEAIEKAAALQATRATEDLERSASEMKAKLAARRKRKQALVAKAKAAASKASTPEEKKEAVVLAAEVNLQIETDNADTEADAVAALEREYADAIASNSDEQGAASGAASQALAERIKKRKAKLSQAESKLEAAEALVERAQSADVDEPVALPIDLDIKALEASIAESDAASKKAIENETMATHSRVKARLDARKAKMAKAVAKKKKAAEAAREAAKEEAAGKIEDDEDAKEALIAHQKQLEEQLTELVGSTDALQAEAEAENKAIHKQKGMIAQRLQKRKEKQRRLRKQQAQLDKGARAE